MPGITQEVKTIMYSVRQEKGHEGEVVVHRFPFNANDKYGMEKLKKFEKRGFTFADPKLQGGANIPQVIVTGIVDLAKPIPAEQTNPEDVVVEPITGTPFPPLGEDIEGVLIAPSPASPETPKPKRKYTKHKKRVKKVEV